MSKLVSGFSKFSKDEKIHWLTNNFFKNSERTKNVLKQYLNNDEALQKLHDDFIENTITNFYLPFGVSPNFIIDKQNYVVPMVIEESSVVAAASLVAKFWSTRGGFKTTILGTTKVGQIHFMYSGSKISLEEYFLKNKIR